MTHCFNLALVLTFGLFVLRSICCPCIAPLCIARGRPLPSDILTLMGVGRAGGRGRSFPLSALGNIVGSGHIPLVAFPPSRQAPVPPNANRWLWLSEPSNCTSFPCSLNFLLLLIWVSSLSPCVNIRFKTQGRTKNERTVARVAHCLRGTERGWREWSAMGHTCQVHDAGALHAQVKQLRCHGWLEHSPGPLIWSLFVWNMIPLNLTSSSTEGEKKKSILIIILTGL